MEPMAKTRAWFENGQTFENAFVSTPFSKLVYLFMAGKLSSLIKNYEII